MFRKSLAALVGLTLALGTGAGFTQPAPTVQVNAPRRAKKGLFGGIVMQPMRAWSYPGPGTTMAQQQRASRKKRNVKRHRASVRGGAVNTPTVYSPEQIRSEPMCCVAKAMPDGRWVAARPLGWQGLFLGRRLRAAWMVFTGRWDALRWEGQ